MTRNLNSKVDDVNRKNSFFFLLFLILQQITPEQQKMLDEHFESKINSPSSFHVFLLFNFPTFFFFFFFCLL